jgi:type VI protein secretion system component VasF
MSQEYEDYADRDPPRAGLPPAVVRLLVAVVLMVALFGFCLLIGVLIDVD